MRRTERLRVIKEIVGSKKISSQDDLLKELKIRGYHVTQSTVSRDINQLGIIKARNYKQEEYYSIENRALNGKAINPEKFISKFTESVVSVKKSGNIIVVRTFPGEAQGTAAVIDGMNFVEILGTVAGDDTIICITDNDSNAQKIMKVMKNQL